MPPLLAKETSDPSAKAACTRRGSVWREPHRRPPACTLVPSKVVHSTRREPTSAVRIDWANVVDTLHGGMAPRRGPNLRIVYAVESYPMSVPQPKQVSACFIDSPRYLVMQTRRSIASDLDVTQLQGTDQATSVGCELIVCIWPNPPPVLGQQGHRLRTQRPVYLTSRSRDRYVHLWHERRQELT
jgi:hypothetical protein